MKENGIDVRQPATLLKRSLEDNTSFEIKNKFYLLQLEFNWLTPFKMN
jgi:hypothetical protein